MSRLQELLSGPRPALITYLCAGDPDPESSAALFAALVEGGADIVEIGVPFSDPGADGPTIQQSSERALAAGAGLDTALSIAKGLPDSVGKVLFGYLNPFLSMGYERLATACAEAGVDGLLCVDCPPEEEPEFRVALRAHGIDPILLVAPTTPEARIAEISRQGAGFLYYVSMTGVTGAALADKAAVSERLAQVKAIAELPVAVGFGIATAEDAAALAGVADGIVVGSALVRLVERDGVDAVEALRELTAQLRGGCQVPQ